MEAAPTQPATRGAALVVGGCGALALAALALPVTLAYDPWTWLVWGRELLHLDLDTTGGPAWKPLPVLVTTPLALLGRLAPPAWLVLSRTAGLLALAGAYRLGRRLGGTAAGALAAGFLVLTPDGGPRFVRLVLEGHTAPWTAALALWAVERHLVGRHRTALGLVTLLAWDRPEAWPFLIAYVVWLWWRSEVGRRWLVLSLGSVAALWFGLDWWGSGSPLHGAGAAQVYAEEVGRLGIAVDHSLSAVLAPVWVLALLGALWRRRRPEVVALVGLALGWILVVVGMSALLGYAALTRFLLPAAALMCVAAATTATDLVHAVPRGWPRRAIVGGLALVVVPFAVQRVAAIDSLYSAMADRGDAEAELSAVLAAAGGVERLRGCERIAIDTRDVPRAALAWRADVPVHAVERPQAPYRGALVARAGGTAAQALDAQGDARRVAAGGRWVVYLVDCG